MAILTRPDMQAHRRFVLIHEMPTDILIETVAHCNMRCVMCPQEHLTRPRGMMDFALWQKIIDELSAKTPGIKIWPSLMGEPFLMGRRLFDYIKYATDRGLDNICLNTNLTVLPDEWLDDLFEARVGKLMISMDGITKETYERIRVGGRFEVLLRNINRLLDEKDKRGAEFPKIALQFIVMDENEHEQEAFIDYWKGQGRDITLKIKPRTGWAAAVPTWNCVSDVSTNDKRIPCTWLLRQMTVLWDGRVPQCDGDWDMKYPVCGDLNVQTVEDVWNGRLKQLRQMHLDHNWHHAPCNTCQDWAAGTAVFHELGPQAGAACHSRHGELCGSPPT